MAMRKCVFFDRDGIVNSSPGAGYVERWEDFHLLPAFVEALRTVRRLGYEAIVVTNQRGVARGIMAIEALERIHCNLMTVLRQQYGLELTDIRYCPHGEDECGCRKPKPGMLLEAARQYALDLRLSWMVGDSAADIAAGQAAGCRTILVGAHEQDTGADYSVADMRALAGLLHRVLKEA